MKKNEYYGEAFRTLGEGREDTMRTAFGKGQSSFLLFNL
jgi:hypothetical protein